MTNELPVLSLNFSDCPIHLENYFVRVLSQRYRLNREERPEFLVYALTGHRHRLYNCTKIWTHHEVYRPNWKECDYAVLPFLGNDPRHYYLPIYAYSRSPEPLLRRNPDWDRIRETKTRFCALLSAYVDRTVRHRMDFFMSSTVARRLIRLDGPPTIRVGKSQTGMSPSWKRCDHINSTSPLKTKSWKAGRRRRCMTP